MSDSVLLLQPRPKPYCGVTDHTQWLIDSMAKHGVVGRRVTLDEVCCMTDGELFKARLFVQTSIYGYQRKGVPFRLATQVARAVRCGALVCGYFHETWVPKAPRLSSGHWLSPVQRWLCHTLAVRFRRAHFNTPWSMAWGQATIGDRARFSPTFSNVGELTNPKPLGERPARLVCFGSLGNRRIAYRSLAEHLPALVAAGHVTELMDIGAGDSLTDGPITVLPGLQVQVLGPAASAEVSAALADARYGLHFTPWPQATKSGIYGALLAHGVMPVSTYEANTLPSLKPTVDMSSHALLMGMGQWCESLRADSALDAFQAQVNRAAKTYKSIDTLAREILADFDTLQHA